MWGQVLAVWPVFALLDRDQLDPLPILSEPLTGGKYSLYSCPGLVNFIYAQEISYLSSAYNCVMS